MSLIPENLSQLKDEESGEILIHSSHVNVTWSDWNLRWLRSMHIGPDNCIISLGLPKFMNLGEGVNEYKITENDILSRAGKDLYATLKIDGTLLVRYVHNGVVKWRTRGSLTVGLDNKSEISQFCYNNPLLENPSIYSDKSILFEWVSPLNKIVIGYHYPQIFLVGAIEFDEKECWYDSRPKLLNMNELTEVSKILNVQLVNWYALNNSDEVTRLIEDLKSNTEIEGFVLRFDNCQKMVKIKAEHYRTLHALRSNLTTAKLVDLWVQWNRPNFNVYEKSFSSFHDYECWQWAMPAVSSMYDGIKHANAIMKHLVEYVESNKMLSRKDFALTSKQKYEGVRLSTCFLLLDKKEIPSDIWKKLVLQNCKQVEMRMFSDKIEI